MSTNVASVYLKGLQDEWLEFQKICKREGTNASAKVREFFTQYVEDHGPGNPQLLLTDLGYRAPKTYRTRANKDIHCPQREEWVYRTICLHCTDCPISAMVRKDMDKKGMIK